jgi:succinate dehydrogenase/fumarate reductase flavoprotein subunit
VVTIGGHQSYNLLTMSRSIEDIENELDQLQVEYINEEDEVKQMDIERKFTSRLEEATSVDNILRTAVGVTITNWTRE